MQRPRLTLNKNPDGTPRHNLLLAFVLMLAALAVQWVIARSILLDHFQQDVAERANRINSRLSAELANSDFANAPRLAHRHLRLIQTREQLEYMVISDTNSNLIDSIGIDGTQALPLTDKTVRLDNPIAHFRSHFTQGNFPLVLQYGLRYDNEALKYSQSITHLNWGLTATALFLIVCFSFLQRHYRLRHETIESLRSLDYKPQTTPRASSGLPHLQDDWNDRNAVHQELATKLAIKGNGDGLWDWDLLSNRSYASPRFMELLGYDEASEFRRQFVFRNALHPDDVDRTIGTLKAHLDHHAPIDLEFRLKTRDGVYRWFRGRALAQWNDDGQAVRIAGSLTDITTQKITEEALRESEQRLFYAVRGAQIGIWDWDIQNNTYYMSPRLKELLGYRDLELPNSRHALYERTHPDDRKEVELAVLNHLEARQPYEVKLRIRCCDNQYRWFLDRGQAIWNIQGEAMRFSGGLSLLVSPPEVQASH